MKRKLVLIAVLVGAFSLGSATVLAFGSSDYTAKAQTWATKNCKAPSKTGDNDSLLCYLFYTSSDHEARIADLEDSTPQTNGKVLKVVLDGNSYGPVVNEQLPTFFYEPIQRFVPINNYGSVAQKLVVGHAIDLVYESSDCTGKPYLSYFDQVTYENTIYNNLLTAGYNNRFIAARDTVPKVINRGSQKSFDYNTESYSCVDGGGISVQVIPAVEAVIPVEDPISKPFQFVYN